MSVSESSLRGSDAETHIELFMNLMQFPLYFKDKYSSIEIWYIQILIAIIAHAIITLP